MTVKFTNNASSSLASGINSTATSLTVADASTFPSLSGADDYCYLTIQQATATTREVVKATARSGNSFTIQRGVDNTTATSFSSGDTVELRLTSALLQDVIDQATVEGIKTNFQYVPTSGQTQFSGADNSGDTMIINDSELVNVYMNGVRLVQGSDYTVSSANNRITLTSGATTADIIDIEVFGNFTGQSGAAVAITGGAIAGTAITTGSINNTPIGATQANTVAATTLTANGVTVGNTSIGSNTSHFPNLTINNNGYIGSANNTTALQIATSGDATFGGTVRGTRLGANASPSADYGVTALQNGSMTHAGYFQANGDDFGVEVNATAGGGYSSSVLYVRQSSRNTGGNLARFANSDGDQFVVTTSGDVVLGEDVSTTTVAKGFSTGHASANRAKNVRYGMTDSTFTGMEIVNAAAANSSYNAQSINFITHEGAVSVATRMTIDSLGRVGIGEDNPNYLLSLNGSGNTFLSINTGNNSGDNSQIKFGDSADDDAGYINYDHQNNKFQFRTNGGANAFELESNGNPVFKGINHTNLQVKSGDDSVVAFLQTVQGSDARFGTSTNHPVNFAQNGAFRLVLDTNGNTRINGLLGVNKGVNTAVALSVGADSTTTSSYGLEVTNASANTRFLVNGLGDAFFYRTDNAAGMKFDATNGNLEVTNKNGSNGTTTSQYGVIAVASGNAQATIGSHHNGDGYANLNLSSVVNGDRKMWHISKRIDSNDNRLELFWYESGGFNSRFLFKTNGDFVSIGQVLGSKGVHGTSVNNVDHGVVVRAGSGDTAASRGRFSNNAADVAIGRNIATYPGQWAKADNSVASAGWVFGSSGAAAFYQSNAGHTTPLANQRFRIMDGSANGRVVIGSSTTTQTNDATKILLGGEGTLVSAYNLASTNEFWILNNLANIASGVVCKVDFRVLNSSKGYIGITSTGVQYNQGSDYRLKDELNYDFDATSLVKKMKPVQFKWLADMDAGIDTGFIAHELQEVHPFAVSGEKDAVREDGEIAPQGVDASKLVGLLTKALQEALSRIDSLEEKVKALEETA